MLESLSINQFQLGLIGAKYKTLGLLRQPSYWIPTALFPTLFFLAFGRPAAQTPEAAAILLASFSGFCIFGILFFQLSTMVAMDRESGWQSYLESLSVGGTQNIVAISVSALTLSTLALIILIAAFIGTTPLELGLETWAYFLSRLFLSSVVFALMGLALGLWTTGKASVPLANLIYLPLSYLGGLWMPPQLLPESVQEISTYLPTRLFGEILWAAVESRPASTTNWAGLGGYGIVFLVIVGLGYRKDQIRKF